MKPAAANDLAKSLRLHRHKATTRGIRCLLRSAGTVEIFADGGPIGRIRKNDSTEFMYAKVGSRCARVGLNRPACKSTRRIEPRRSAVAFAVPCSAECQLIGLSSLTKKEARLHFAMENP